MELSKRLYAVASAVTAGSRLADIGTDHGYVPIYLTEREICPTAIAMDVNEGPLQRAREHIAENGLSLKIATRLSDGLQKLQPEEVDSIVMAGMGGDLICRIMKTCPAFTQAGKEFILQPQSEWDKVRHFLEEIDYGIVQEDFLKEDGKYYVILKCRPGADHDIYKHESLEPEFLYEYGPLLARKMSPVWMEYLSRQLRKKKNIVANIKNLQKSFDLDEKTALRIKALEKEIFELEKLIQFA